MVRVSFTSRSGTMTLDENENEKNEWVGNIYMKNDQDRVWRHMW